MGRSVSSVLVLDRLRRGDEGVDEYGDSFWDTCRRSMKREYSCTRVALAAAAEGLAAGEGMARSRSSGGRVR